jgi:RNA polymerase sigma-70 factor (family 1)
MAEGDRNSFTILYRRYWEDLFIIGVKVTCSKEDAADIVQEVFLSLWRRREEISITSSLGAYLKTSVRYKAIHYIEKNITRRRYLDILTELTEDQFASSPEMFLQAKEMQGAVKDAVSRMPPKMQQVYILSRHEYLTHREIAARLDISEETVKKHIQHGLQLIKTSLGESLVSLALILFAVAR